MAINMTSFKTLFEAGDEYPKLIKNYPRAGGKVDGRRVLKNVDNTASIGATLNDWDSLPGIRKVKMKEFGGPFSTFYAKDDFDRAKALSEKIRESGEISPLIIVIDDEGPYILEGAHRYVALYYLKAKKFPALIVVDVEEYEE
jgi:disulfide oxidoreductase YuzD